MKGIFFVWLYKFSEICQEYLRNIEIKVNTQINKNEDSAEKKLPVIPWWARHKIFRNKFQVSGNQMSWHRQTKAKYYFWGGYKVQKEPSLTKRCEKMRKEPSFLRKQALLYRNKVFLKRVYIKHNTSEL